MTKVRIYDVLNEAQGTIFDLINRGQINEAKMLVIDCINNPAITDKAAVAKAKIAFSKPGQNHFLSTLMTYMTCMKVG